jgi:hypothetical protein
MDQDRRYKYIGAKSERLVQPMNQVAAGVVVNDLSILTKSLRRLDPTKLLGGLGKRIGLRKSETGSAPRIRKDDHCWICPSARLVQCRVGFDETSPGHRSFPIQLVLRVEQDLDFGRTIERPRGARNAVPELRDPPSRSGDDAQGLGDGIDGSVKSPERLFS